MGLQHIAELPLALYHRLAEAPRLVERGEAVVSELVQAVVSLRALGKHLLDLRTRVDSTYVYVLPPNAAMMVHAARVGPGKRHQLCFQPHVPIDAGAWIVAVGPAVVRNVFVGNNVQSSASDFTGQVCKTVDPLMVGMNLRVDLEGPEAIPFVDGHRFYG